MEGLIGLAILACIGWWIYRVGKQTGSKKGYGVAMSRRRRRRR